MALLVYKLTESAVAPKRMTDGAAGFDVYSDENTAIGPGERKLVSTGVTVIFPEGYHGILKSRSSVAWNRMVDVCAGVIDEDYRGELRVLLHNAHPKNTFFISPGDRIAQLLVQKTETPEVQVIEYDPKAIQKLTGGTGRGVGGFGSTGN